MSRVCYIGFPIDKDSSTSADRVLIDQIVDHIVGLGWVVYNPRLAWQAKSFLTPGPEIESVNRAALASAGIVVIFLPSGVQTVGAPMEIEAACQSNADVAVWCPEPGWALAGTSAKVFRTLEDLAAWVPRAPAEPAPRSRLRQVMFHVDDQRGGILPLRSHSGDAGWDLFTSETVEVPPRQFVDLPCAVRVALPPGTWARITGRSSTLRKWGLMAVDGVIDEGYRGELFAAVQSMVPTPVVVPKGTRLTQLILHQNVAPGYDIVPVNRDLFERIPTPDERGSDGFGSTGLE